MTTLPAAADFRLEPMSALELSDGIVAIRDYLAGLFGTDGETATALAALGALVGGYSARTSASSVTATDRGRLIDATSGTWTLSLLAAATAGAGFAFAVRNAGAGTITLDPDGSEPIDGASTIALGPGRAALVVCTGTAWATLALPGTAAGPLRAPQGSVSAPAVARADDDDTGLYFPAADQVALAAGGVQALLASTTALTAPLPVLLADGTAAAPSLSFAADTDTGIIRPTSNVLAVATAGVERMRVTGTGRVMIGYTTAPTGVSSGLGVHSATGSLAAVSVYGVNDTPSTAPLLMLARARGADVTAAPLVSGGDVLGEVRFLGGDGTQLLSGAAIRAVAAGTPAAGDVPADLRFLTRPAAGGILERMRLTSDGNLGINTTAPSTTLHVNGPVRVGSYTVATVPSASGSGAGAIIYVSNETGGAVLAFSDGTNWRRVTDRAVIA